MTSSTTRSGFKQRVKLFDQGTPLKNIGNLINLILYRWSYDF